jgi:hypothetical protein
MIRTALAGLAVLGWLAANSVLPAERVPTQPVTQPTNQQVFIVGNESMPLPFQWGPPSHGLMLGIAIERSSVLRQTPIQLWFAVKNVSHNERTFFRLGDLSDYDVTVRDSNKHLREPIPGSAGSEFDGSIRPTFTIEPNGAFVYRVLDLNDFFALEPGRYTLTATSDVFLNYKEERGENIYTVLSSGSLELTVRKSP